jgi:hypothetical protein
MSPEQAVTYATATADYLSSAMLPTSRAWRTPTAITPAAVQLHLTSLTGAPPMGAEDEHLAVYRSVCDATRERIQREQLPAQTQCGGDWLRSRTRTPQ